MYLLINLSEKDLIHLALFNNEKIEHKKSLAQNRELLSSLDKFLHEQGLSTKDIQGIMVVVGSGGFTSTRIGTVVGNAFGFLLQISLLAITQDQVQNVRKFIPKLRTQPCGQYIAASYSAEAQVRG